MKALKILDATTLYYTQICILIKLLHRYDFTKKLLMQCLDNSTVVKIDLHKDIDCKSKILNFEIKNIIDYPDKTRDL